MSFPSVLQVISTVVTVGPDGKAGVQVSCGAGDGGCAGVIAVSDDTGATLGTIPYDMKEQATPTLPVPVAVPVAVPAGASELTFTFTPARGVAPPKPATVPVQRG